MDILGWWRVRVRLDRPEIGRLWWAAETARLSAWHGSDVSKSTWPRWVTSLDLRSLICRRVVAPATHNPLTSPQVAWRHRNCTGTGSQLPTELRRPTTRVAWVWGNFPSEQFPTYGTNMKQCPTYIYLICSVKIITERFIIHNVREMMAKMYCNRCLLIYVHSFLHFIAALCCNIRHTLCPRMGLIIWR